jgi:hypothetical protein
MSASSNGPAMSLFPELIQGSIAKFVIAFGTVMVNFSVVPNITNV